MNPTIEKIKVGLLAIIAICAIVLTVKICFGSVSVQGDVDVSGSRVRVSGDVSVDNVVQTDIEYVMGLQVGSHKSYTIDGKEYHAIDVWNRGY